MTIQSNKRQERALAWLKSFQLIKRTMVKAAMMQLHQKASLQSVVEEDVSIKTQSQAPKASYSIILKRAQYRRSLIKDS